MLITSAPTFPDIDSAEHPGLRSLKGTTVDTSSEREGDWYEIRIQGRLDARWSTWLDGLTLSQPDDGTTVLRGVVTDQAALHGTLNRIRNLNLPIISVIQIDPDPDPLHRPNASTDATHSPHTAKEGQSHVHHPHP